MLETQRDRDEEEEHDHGGDDQPAAVRLLPGPPGRPARPGTADRRPPRRRPPGPHRAAAVRGAGRRTRRTRPAPRPASVAAPASVPGAFLLLDPLSAPSPGCHGLAAVGASAW